MASVMSSEGNKKPHLSSSCTDSINDTKHVSVYLVHHISEYSFVVYKKKQKQTSKPKPETNHPRCTHAEQNLE